MREETSGNDILSEWLFEEIGMDPRTTRGRPAKKLRKSIMKDRRRYFDILLSNTMFLLHIRIHKETPNRKVRRSHSEHSSVNQLGLEPRTPSLKGMCSTCWATDSPTFFQKRVQRYCFFLKYANFLVKKMIKTHICWILWRGGRMFVVESREAIYSERQAKIRKSI